MATTTVYRSIKQQPSSLIGLLKSCSLSLAGSRLTSQAMDRKIEEYYLSTLINDSDVFPYARKGDFMSSVLSERKDIRQAQALLYANYKDHNWVWAEDNPTGFQLKQQNGLKYVTDKFEEDSAMWIGTFTSSELIGAVRLTFRTEDNPLLDMELYDSATQCPTLRGILKNENLVEISRFVTSPEYRSKGVGGTMSLLVMFMFLAKYNYSAVFTSQLDFFAKYGIGTLVNRSFDYGDGIHTNSWYYNEKDIATIAKLLKRKITS